MAFGRITLWYNGILRRDNFKLAIFDKKSAMLVKFLYIILTIIKKSTRILFGCLMNYIYGIDKLYYYSDKFSACNVKEWSVVILTVNDGISAEEK